MSENSTKIFCATPRSHGHSGDAEGYRETHTRSKFSGAENRSKLSPRTKAIETKLFY